MTMTACPDKPRIVIVLATSALMAIVLGEREAEDIAEALAHADDLAISAATVAEALIVSRRRGVGEAMAGLSEGLGATIAPVTEADAEVVANAYGRWGKGVHPAGLNFGDCFAYALAKCRKRPLLFVGDDFAQTDIESAHVRRQMV
jgi:ribonuclease VapC